MINLWLVIHVIKRTEDVRNATKRNAWSAKVITLLFIQAISALIVNKFKNAYSVILILVLNVNKDILLIKKGIV